MTTEEINNLKEISNVIYNTVVALDSCVTTLAKVGTSVSSRLQNPSEGQVVKFIFDKDLQDTFVEGTEEEKAMMQDAYRNDKFIPLLGTEHAAAYDIRAYLPPDAHNKIGTFTLHPMETKVISTNLIIEVPIGYKAVVEPRSGLATKGIVISNSPGKIDADYRGVVGVILYNNGGSPFTITHGDRIAQISLEKLEPTTWQHVDKLSDTARGKGGFGHTGIK